jgi:cytochrome o ubiquinol oxidase subunit 2
MSKKRVVAAVILISGFLTLSAIYLSRVNIPLLEPKGTIGLQERRLIIIAGLLSLVVVVPVYIMLVGFAWRYREGNKKARYDPNFDHSRLFESIWWGVPLILITILAIVTWNSSHSLDPFKPLNPGVPAMKIQVVAMQWKWLFIYPGQNIASLNYVQFPANTPVDFQITSDAPMNSFWIPQLGGQIYAMSGMKTDLNLEATKIGDYEGSSANISGEGFASMHFTARASSESEFNQWLKYIHQADNVLSPASYRVLSAPSKENPITYFSHVNGDIFNWVINKYEEPVFITSEAR